ncbi:Tat pathway signal protein (plasmid) [Streptomyces sp. NBC_01724]|uniref:Tat pathway signal protein n=1 Tax=unclassified Streptomyces TaxID=2593676 RepID=UPI002E30C9AE|nr:Tat pathway signal protein [Streptomyces sp. NBC_01724]
MTGHKNQELAAWLDSQEMKPPELAEELNAALLTLTGRRGKLTERTVFRWLSGENQWPQTKCRVVLEQVTGRSITELGFVRPQRGTAGPAPQEDPVRRRAFITASTATVLAAAAASAARPTVGTSDVLTLRSELAALWSLDDTAGGSPDLENKALALVERTRGLQQNGSATQKTRSRLYALAAAFTATAMWAAVDSRRFAGAQTHLNEAIHLAGLSGDGQVQHQIWRYAAMLADQRGRHADSVAAAEAAMNTRAHRTDPLYASLSHARLALSAASAGDRLRAQRAIGRAVDAFGRADLAHRRPASMEFYTLGELHGLTGITHYRLGQGEEAEFHAHRCLAALRPEQNRNRAYYTAQTALSQLQQGEMELACATAGHVLSEHGADTGRVLHLLGTFTANLNQRAPGAGITRTWNTRARTA